MFTIMFNQNVSNMSPPVTHDAGAWRSSRKNNSGEHYVLLRWYTEIGRYPVELVPMLPHLRLADPFLTKSYDVLPVNCILNGALLVPHGKEHWALMSPREHAAYESMNTD